MIRPAWQKPMCPRPVHSKSFISFPIAYRSPDVGKRDSSPITRCLCGNVVPVDASLVLGDVDAVDYLIVAEIALSIQNSICLTGRRVPKDQSMLKITWPACRFSVATIMLVGSWITQIAEGATASDVGPQNCTMDLIGARCWMRIYSRRVSRCI